MDWEIGDGEKYIALRTLFEATSQLIWPYLTYKLTSKHVAHKE